MPTRAAQSKNYPLNAISVGKGGKVAVVKNVSIVKNRKTKIVKQKAIVKNKKIKVVHHPLFESRYMISSSGTTGTSRPVLEFTGSWYELVPHRIVSVNIPEANTTSDYLNIPLGDTIANLTNTYEYLEVYVSASLVRSTSGTASYNGRPRLYFSEYDGTTGGAGFNTVGGRDTSNADYCNIFARDNGAGTIIGLNNTWWDWGNTYNWHNAVVYSKIEKSQSGGLVCKSRIHSSVAGGEGFFMKDACSEQYSTALRFRFGDSTSGRVYGAATVYGWKKQSTAAFTNTNLFSASTTDNYGKTDAITNTTHFRCYAPILDFHCNLSGSAGSAAGDLNLTRTGSTESGKGRFVIEKHGGSYEIAVSDTPSYMAIGWLGTKPLTHAAFSSRFSRGMPGCSFIELYSVFVALGNGTGVSSASTANYSYANSQNRWAYELDKLNFHINDNVKPTNRIWKARLEVSMPTHICKDAPIPIVMTDKSSNNSAISFGNAYTNDLLPLASFMAYDDYVEGYNYASTDGPYNYAQSWDNTAPRRTIALDYNTGNTFTKGFYGAWQPGSGAENGIFNPLNVSVLYISTCYLSHILTAPLRRQSPTSTVPTPSLSSTQGVSSIGGGVTADVRLFSFYSTAVSGTVDDQNMEWSVGWNTRTNQRASSYLRMIPYSNWRWG
jgi:hypothetical protein